jgi:hypothetical protein
MKNHKIEIGDLNENDEQTNLLLNASIIHLSKITEEIYSILENR